MRRRCRRTLMPTHRSLFDGSLQGVARTDRPAFSFQGHPEASPGPHDLRPLFESFMQLMVRRLQNQLRRCAPMRAASAEVSRAVNAQAHRPQEHPDHRRRPDRDRPGLRVRLFRRAGLQGAARGGLSRHPGQLQSGHDHDRPGDAPMRSTSSRSTGAPWRSIIERERPDALLPTMGGQTALNYRARPGARGRAQAVRRRADRRLARGDRHGRGSRAVPQCDARDRARGAALADRAQPGRGARGAEQHRLPDRDPARPSRWAAAAAASPTTARNSRPSCSAGWMPRRRASCCSRRRCSAGKNSRWRWCATARTTASSSARSRISIRWACTPAIRSPSRRRRR